MGVVGEGPVGEETEEEGEVGGVAVGWVRRLVGLLSSGDVDSDGVVVERELPILKSFTKLFLFCLLEHQR